MKEVTDKFIKIRKKIEAYGIKGKIHGINSSDNTIVDYPIQLKISFNLSHRELKTLKWTKNKHLKRVFEVRKQIIEQAAEHGHNILNHTLRYNEFIQKFDEILKRYNSDQIMIRMYNLRDNHVLDFNAVIKITNVKDPMLFDFTMEMIETFPEYIQTVLIPMSEKYLQLKSDFNEFTIVVGPNFFKKYKYSLKHKDIFYNNQTRYHIFVDRHMVTEDDNEIFNFLSNMTGDTSKNDWMELQRNKSDYGKTFYIKNDEILTALTLCLRDVIDRYDITMKIPEDEFY